jgi:TrmH family RNA methyltransferase
MRQSVSSTDNPRIRLLRSLRAAKSRREHSLFLAEGPVVIAEALAAGWVPEFLVCDADRQEEYGALLDALEARGCSVMMAPSRIVSLVSDTRTPQGLAAAYRWAAQPLGERLPAAGVIVLLDKLQDPGNMGTLLRTADAVGAAGVVVSPGCADVTAPKVVRAAMGSLFRVPVFADDLVAALTALRRSGWRSLCGHLDGRDFFSRGEDAAGTALVIGNEAAGVSDRVANCCDEKVRLPMPGCAPSLNAAVAAGIMLYDIVRRSGRLNAGRAGEQHNHTTTPKILYNTARFRYNRKK